LHFPAVNNNRVDKSAEKSLKIKIDGGILTPDGVIAKNKVDIQLNGAARAIASYEVPEPTSTLSLLALGFLGTALTLKRKLKSSQSTEKKLQKSAKLLTKNTTNAPSFSQLSGIIFLCIVYCLST